MKNYYILMLASLLAWSASAQVVLPKKKATREVPRTMEKSEISKKLMNQNKAITCLDTSLYPDFKASTYSIYYYNAFGNTEGAAQTYHYTGSAEIIGVYYYTVHDLDGTPGDKPAIPVNFKVYDVDGTNTPTTAIRSELGSVADAGFSYQSHIFATPVPVNGNFALTMEMDATAAVTDTFYNVANGDGDGLGEALGNFWAPGFGGWFSTASLGYDIDFLIMPIIRHNLNASFTIGDVCLNVGEILDITNTSSWVPDSDVMFNVNTLVGGSIYGWDFGDGNGSSAQTPLHSYSTAGSYTITLSDTLYTWTGGCLESTSFRVSVGLNGSVVSSTDPLCNGGADGTITLSGAGGISPYTYSSNGTTFGSTNPLTGFTSGSKTVFIQDSLGCRDTMTTTLSQPTAVTVDSQSSTPAACGGSDGTVTFSGTGGTGTITYSINGSTYDTTGSYTGLTATTYTLYAKDANGCVGTSTETVSNSGAPTFSSTNSTNVACNGGSDGTITLSGTGGTGILQYSIDGTNFFSSGSFTGLSAATYTATVKDSAGCTSSQNVSVLQPAAITADAGANQTVCENVSGAAVSLSGSITVASGYSWTSTSGTFSDSTTQNTTFTPSATQIAAGTATVTLTTTGNGACSAATDDVVITITPAPIADAGADQTACANNATITLAGSVQNATGGTWTSGGVGTLGNANSLTSSYTATTPGTKTLVLTTTGNGICAASRDTMIVTITPSPTADAGAIGAACEGDTIDLNGVITVATGATWTTSGTGTISNPTSLATSYVVTTQDGANGSLSFTLTTTGNGNCVAASDGVFWFADPAPAFDLGADTTLCDTLGALSLTVGLGADYSYLWSNGVVQETNNVTTSGTYSVTVTDTNSCEATDAITVTFNNCDTTGGGLSVSGEMTSWVRLFPNPTTGIVNVKMNVDQVTTLEVINIIGEVVNARTFNANSSNATIDISNQKNGVYFFRITKGNEVVTKQINLVR